MPDGHEAHTEEKTESSSKVGDEGIESVDVRFLRHIHRGVAWPEGKYEVLTLEWKTLWFSMELELVENARPLAFGYCDNSFIITPSQVPIDRIIIPEAFSLGGIFQKMKQTRTIVNPKKDNWTNSAYDVVPDSVHNAVSTC